MKKYMLLIAVALALAIPGVSWSQTAPAGGPQPGQGGPAGEHGQGGQNFQEHKAEHLKRMNERLAEIQKRIACVEAATDHQALRACMPQRPEGGPEGRHEGHCE